MAQLVNEIIVLEIELGTSNPPMVNIATIGQVPTMGWTDPELPARVYAKPPADGIQEFDFVATPPSQSEDNMTSDVAAQAYFVKPDWCIGVRVYAQTNQMEKTF